MCGAYLGLGASVFRKRDGRLPLSTKVILGPFLLTMRLTHWCLSRGRVEYSDVMPGIVAGGRLGRGRARRLRRLGVAAVLDLTAEYSETLEFRRLNYLNIPILDLTAPTPGELDRACRFIAAQSRAGVVYVHCALGISRTDAVIRAYRGRNGIKPRSAPDRAGKDEVPREL